VSTPIGWDKPPKTRAQLWRAGRRNELVTISVMIAQGIAALRTREGWTGSDGDVNAAIANDAVEIASEIIARVERKHPR